MDLNFVLEFMTLLRSYFSRVDWQIWSDVKAIKDIARVSLIDISVSEPRCLERASLIIRFEGRLKGKGRLWLGISMARHGDFSRLNFEDLRQLQGAQTVLYQVVRVLVK